MHEKGANMREKERPNLKPKTKTESLFYKGLIGLAFFEDDAGAAEFIYLPDEFLTFLARKGEIKGQSELEYIQNPGGAVQPTGSQILDDMAVSLAALRGDVPLEERRCLIRDENYAFALALLKGVGIINKDNSLETGEGLIKILTDPREAVHLKVLTIWKESASINELRMLPGLVFEGKWKNDPVLPRQRLLNILSSFTQKKWINLSEFLRWMHDNEPNILRSGGEYDSWFIRSSGSGEFLKGFARWHEIEGEWIRFMIGNVIHALGFVDIAFDKKSGEVKSFRKSGNFDRIFQRDLLPEARVDTNCFVLQKNGKVLVSKDSTREALYHIARICQWESRRGERYRFMLNHASLMRAKAQGLSSANIISLIKKYGQEPLPENILRGISGWERPSNTAVLEPHTLIRVEEQPTLDRIIKGAGQNLIVERLNEKTALIRKKDAQRLAEKLADIGIFIEMQPDIDKLKAK